MSLKQTFLFFCRSAGGETFNACQAEKYEEIVFELRNQTGKTKSFQVNRSKIK